MDYAKESLKLHYRLHGKLETVPKLPVANKDDLSLAYTPVSYTHLAAAPSAGGSKGASA